jgi:hypothetical protein
MRIQEVKLQFDPLNPQVIFLFNGNALNRAQVSSFLTIAGIAFIRAYNMCFLIISKLEYLGT